MAFVMIIDDDEDFANAAARVLRNAGHEVQAELNIPGGLSAMERRAPDLLILDVMFPEDPTGGFQLARQMRHSGAGLRSVPIVLLTAVNSRFPLGFSSKDIDAEWMPVSEFLEKPVDLDVLSAKVTEMLNGN